MNTSEHSVDAYPLAWPAGWPRAQSRVWGQFKGTLDAARTGPDVWELLGLAPDADEAEILAAYRERAKTAHPIDALTKCKDIALATVRSRKAGA